MYNNIKIKRITSLLLSVVLVFTIFTGCSSEESVPVDNGNLESIGSENWDNSDNLVENRAKMTRGFTLSAGADYTVEGKSYEEVCTEIETLFDTMKASYFNTVFIDLLHNGKAIFKSSVIEYFAAFDQDITELIYKVALDRGFYIYFVFDIGQYSPVDPLNANNDFINIIGNLVNTYTYLSGILYTNYSYNFDENIYSHYITSGSLSGVENHKFKVMNEYIDNIIKSTKRFSSKIFVGVDFDGDSAINEGNLKITDYCHLPFWIKNGMTDFAAIKTNSENNNTEYFFNLWGDVSSESTQKYVKLNINDDMFFDMFSKATEYNFNGIIVEGTKTLIENTELWNKIKELDNKIFSGVSENERNTILKIYNPSSSNITTDEKYYYINGTSDPLHPVYINDQEVETDNLGNFSHKVELADGANNFVIKHKEFSESLTIKYSFNVMRSVTPTSTAYLNGSSKLTVSAICVKGASVTAVLNGQTITLAASDGSSESSFVTYTGIFTMPAANDKTQNLGKIVFNVTYNGKQVSKNGSSIYINKISGLTPEVDKDFNYTNTSGKVGYILRVEREQIETFNGDTADNRSRCVNAYLPKGTLDYCEANDTMLNESDAVYYYRLMNYGKRVYTRTESYRGTKADYVSIFYGSLPDYNTMSVASTENNGRHTYITLNSEWKAPFNVTLAPQEYQGINKVPAEYNVESTTYEYIDFSFSYCTSATGNIDLSNDPVFTKAEWIKGSNGEYTLRLHLRRKGMFCGWSASYNSNGQLVLGFLNPAKITAANNSYGYTLENTVIMLDPGHGGKGDSGATGFATSKDQYECALNLILAYKVKNILEDLGATVIMTRTTDTQVTLDERNSLARQYKPDIFISFHRNGSTSEKKCGYSTYYYNPFSMKLAKEIATKCDALRSCGSTLLNYSPPMQVCRISECPSILTENWFMTNQQDFNLIITDDFNNKNAEATVKGIIAYFKYIQ